LDALDQPHVAVVYLRARPETLAERVRRDDQPRPLLAAAPLEQLRDMHEVRDARYEALALRVEVIDERSPAQIAGSVLDALAADLAVPGLPRGTDG
jgi:shikimate kinase